MVQPSSRHVGVRQHTTGGVLKLTYIAAAYLRHPPPHTGPVLAGDCWRGVGAACKLSWSQKCPLFQEEVYAYRAFAGGDVNLFPGVY